MNLPEPQTGVRYPFRRREAKHRFDSWAHVEPLAFRAGLRHVQYSRELLDEQSMASFRLGQFVSRFMSGIQAGLPLSATRPGKPAPIARGVLSVTWRKVSNSAAFSRCQILLEISSVFFPCEKV